MDIQYHYFVIKTLAAYAGFVADEAQTIAYYSQQVDDFTKCLPMKVSGQPPEFFINNGFAKQKKNGDWMVVPHPTGIDVVQSLDEHYRHTTHAPFHFIPPRDFALVETRESFSRADYRCVCASNDKEAVLVSEIVNDAVNEVKAKKCEKSLMQLGMALHTYADTYAHCGYSGLSGWENRAVIKKAYNQTEQKEEVPGVERLLYKELPHIGHGNSGHVPDVCSYQIEVAMLSDEDDKDYSEHIRRDNLETFIKCSRNILDFLCSASGTPLFDDAAWAELAGKLHEAMPVKTSEESESKKDELAKHWSGYFKDIDYSYDKNERFYHKEDDPLTYNVTQAFYDFNELSYERAEKVLGSEKRFDMERQLLSETLEEKAELSEAIRTASFMDAWKPETELGTAAHAAGFDSFPNKDILRDIPDSTVKEMLQKIDGGLTTEYNNIREKYNIETNDPNVISRILTDHTGTEGKRLHGKLVTYYRMIADIKENAVK